MQRSTDSRRFRWTLIAALALISAAACHDTTAPERIRHCVDQTSISRDGHTLPGQIITMTIVVRDTACYDPQSHQVR